jgi:hypothetical protein
MMKAGKRQRSGKSRVSSRGRRPAAGQGRTAAAVRRPLTFVETAVYLQLFIELLSLMEISRKS